MDKQTLREFERRTEAWCAGENQVSGAVEHSSRRMFVARLENLAQTGHHRLTVAEVLALLNDCDMLAAMK